jgi:hypothetical protein
MVRTGLPKTEKLGLLREKGAVGSLIEVLGFSRGVKSI